jgi:two-component system CheB/CheR fusion protein
MRRAAGGDGRRRPHRTGVLNLLSNALKFTDTGGTISIATAREGNTARIDIADTGQGIAADFLPRVFDMFGQASSVTTRSKGGLGIGLALVREIAELHGGRVDVHSDGPGKGARFSIWLPLVVSASLPHLSAESDLAGSIRGLSILLVDDVEDMLWALQSVLEMEGATVYVATNGNDGLRILAEHEVDLLVSDISMPEMDGNAFVKAVHAMPRYAALPAIAVSGLGRGKDVDEALRSGFTSHISKPMSMERLIIAIDTIFPDRKKKADAGTGD